jgi:hypothetical protein|tara:strand:+ start:17243 stop:17368 length:126 start_codon:yes stop_codon:yes gene_type:complete
MLQAHNKVAKFEEICGLVELKKAIKLQTYIRCVQPLVDEIN